MTAADVLNEAFEEDPDGVKYFLFDSFLCNRRLCDMLGINCPDDDCGTTEMTVLEMLNGVLRKIGQPRVAIVRDASLFGNRGIIGFADWETMEPAS